MAFSPRAKSWESSPKAPLFLGGGVVWGWPSLASQVNVARLDQELGQLASAGACWALWSSGPRPLGWGPSSGTVGALHESLGHLLQYVLFHFMSKTLPGNLEGNQLQGNGSL